MALESRYLEETVIEIQQRINMTNGALTELRVSSLTLEGLEKEKKGTQLFVPIGGGSYVKAKLETSKKVVVGVGEDVAVEKSVKKAKEELETRISEFEKTREGLGQQLNQVFGRIQQNRTKMEEITTKLREGEKQTGVRQAKKGA